VASKSSYSEGEKGAEIEEQLDALDKLVDRLRVLYEQYFLAIAKQAPSHLHTEAERRIRDLTQLQIRNTALRYRFATITQKFGAYNTYWRRTMREIEAGRYVRDLSRIRRKAAQHGDEIPPEILAAMPQRMRDMIERDRVVARAGVERRTAGEDDVAVIRASAPVREPHQVHRFDSADLAGDVDARLDEVLREAEAAVDRVQAAAPPTPPAGAAARRPLRPASSVRAGSVPPMTRERTELPPGMTEAETRALYVKFLKARELVGESNEGMTYEKLLRTLRQQSAKIMEQYQAKGVEFGVAIKERRVVLKAKPKR